MKKSRKILSLIMLIALFISIIGASDVLIASGANSVWYKLSTDSTYTVTDNTTDNGVSLNITSTTGNAVTTSASSDRYVNIDDVTFTIDTTNFTGRPMIAFGSKPGLTTFGTVGKGFYIMPLSADMTWGGYGSTSGKWVENQVFNYGAADVKNAKMRIKKFTANDVAAATALGFTTVEGKHYLMNLKDNGDINFIMAVGGPHGFTSAFANDLETLTGLSDFATAFPEGKAYITFGTWGASSGTIKLDKLTTTKDNFWTKVAQDSNYTVTDNQTDDGVSLNITSTVGDGVTTAVSAERVVNIDDAVFTIDTTAFTGRPMIAFGSLPGLTTFGTVGKGFYIMPASADMTWGGYGSTSGKWTENQIFNFGATNVKIAKMKIKKFTAEDVTAATALGYTTVEGKHYIMNLKDNGDINFINAVGGPQGFQAGFANDLETLTGLADFSEAFPEGKAYVTFGTWAASSGTIALKDIDTVFAPVSGDGGEDTSKGTIISSFEVTLPTDSATWSTPGYVYLHKKGVSPTALASDADGIAIKFWKQSATNFRIGISEPSLKSTTLQTRIDIPLADVVAAKSLKFELTKKNDGKYMLYANDVKINSINWFAASTSEDKETKDILVTSDLTKLPTTDALYNSADNGKLDFFIDFPAEFKVSGETTGMAYTLDVTLPVDPDTLPVINDWKSMNNYQNLEAAGTGVRIFGTGTGGGGDKVRFGANYQKKMKLDNLSWKLNLDNNTGAGWVMLALTKTPMEGNKFTFENTPPTDGVLILYRYLKNDITWAIVLQSDLAGGEIAASLGRVPSVDFDPNLRNTLKNINGQYFIAAGNDMIYDWSQVPGIAYSGAISINNAYEQASAKANNNRKFADLFPDGECYVSVFVQSAKDDSQIDFSILDITNNFVPEVIKDDNKFDEDTGISMDYAPGTLVDGAKLVAENLASDNDTYKAIFADLKNEIAKLQVTKYDFVKDNTSVQVTDQEKFVQLKIPVPNGFDTSRLSVLRVDSSVEGGYEVLAYSILNGNIVLNVQKGATLAIAELINSDDTNSDTDDNTNSDNQNGGNDDGNNPGTSDNVTLMIMFTMLVSAFGVLVISKKRNIIKK